jgi:hypothetical protein
MRYGDIEWVVLFGALVAQRLATHATSQPLRFDPH